VNIESTLYGRVERPNPAELPGGARIEDALKGQRNLIFADDGHSTSVPIYDGAGIRAGHRVSGPAVIEEETATIVIQPGWQIELHKSASYVITKVH